VKIGIEELLRWRRDRQEVPELAPLEEIMRRARPFWEREPAAFLAALRSLGALPVLQGAHASTEGAGRPATVRVGVANLPRAFQAKLLEFAVSQSRLWVTLGLPEQLDAAITEVAFVERSGDRVVLSGSVESRDEATLRIVADANEMPEVWAGLNAAAEMPFDIVLLA
jgi:hypothetical protein